MILGRRPVVVAVPCGPRVAAGWLGTAGVFLSGNQKRGEVSTDATETLCHPGRRGILQANGVFCASGYGLMGWKCIILSIVCSRAVVFLYPFKYQEKEEFNMTIMKNELNNIWSRVRDDLDVDDLIFDYEAYHTAEDSETVSER